MAEVFIPFRAVEKYNGRVTNTGILTHAVFPTRIDAQAFVRDLTSAGVRVYDAPLYKEGNEYLVSWYPGR